MWLLVLTIAFAPVFEPIVQTALYISKKDCERALAVAEDREAVDGIIIFGRCEPRSR